jgi:4-carboxymuconolactone decarboxylase
VRWTTSAAIRRRAAPESGMSEPLPRVPQITVAEEDAAARAVLEIFEAGPNNHVVRTLAQHPVLAQLFLTYNRHLLRTSTLDPRQRQIAIMRTTWTNDATYMWSSHLRMSLRVGLNRADFEAVKQGAGSPHWSPLERFVVRAVDEYNAHHVLSDATWNGLAAQLEQRQIMDLLFTIGTYALAGFVINTLRIDREPELQALAEQYGAPPWPNAPAER